MICWNRSWIDEMSGYQI